VAALSVAQILLKGCRVSDIFVYILVIVENN